MNIKLISLWLVVGLHLFVVFATLVSLFVLPFKVEWYLWIPISCGLIPNLLTPGDCYLSVIENRIRKSLGLSKVDKFVAYYILNKRP